MCWRKRKIAQPLSTDPHCPAAKAGMRCINDGRKQNDDNGTWGFRRRGPFVPLQGIPLEKVGPFELGLEGYLGFY